MGTIKDRDVLDLKGEDIKKKWQAYTVELYMKGLNDLDNRDRVIIHLGPSS